MPKKSLGHRDPGAETVTVPIGTWVGAGLSLAVIGLAIQFGVFAVYAAVLLAPMIYVFARLRGYSARAQTTSDLVGAVLGERFGVFSGLVQLVAYLFLAVTFARVLAVSLLGWIVDLDETYVPVASFAVVSILATVVAGVLVQRLPVRGIAWAVALLAALGVLVYFYLALALVALIARGDEPRHPGVFTAAASEVTYTPAEVLIAVLFVVGFEVVTAINRDVRSAGRSMGVALALTGSCALIVAAALSAGLFRSVHRPTDLPFVAWVTAYLGDAGAGWVLAANLAFGCAGLLVLMLAAVNVGHRLAQQLMLPWRSGARIGGVVAIVGALLIAEWLRVGFGFSGLVNIGQMLLLVVYACAAHACARIPGSGPQTPPQAVRVFVWLLVAGFVAASLRGPDSAARAEWLWYLGIAGIVVVAATAFAVKTKRLQRSPEMLENSGGFGWPST